jgi:tRNA threonylcarbamoyladenosine biosynthesis protein TsaB
VATDARREEVYWARYDVDKDVPRRVDGPHVTRPDAVVRRDLPVVGRGALLYPQDLPGPSDPLDASAAHLAGIAARALDAGSPDLLPPDPLYLRRPDATEPGARKPVLQ